MFNQHYNKSKILILVPGQEARGGITAYYQALQPLFSLPIEYLERGSRKWPQKESLVFNVFQVIKDVYIFWQQVRRKKYKLVLTNTSFSSQAILRDGLYLIIARFYKLKTIVFFHGWDYNFAEKIEKRYFKIFSKIFLKANSIIDLSKKNVDLIKKWDYRGNVYLESTVVDMDLVKDITEENVLEKYNSGNLNLLFLARLEKTKGIYEAIDTYTILKKRFKNLSLTIAGDGSEEGNIIKYISANQLEDIKLLGFVEGSSKITAFNDSHFYIFPSYFEGMPTSLLEAMAFGLPVITRDVGGISGFFKYEVNGYITESKDPLELAALLEKLLLNISKTREISLYNYRYAKEHFLSDKVVSRIEEIISSTLNG